MSFSSGASQQNSSGTSTFAPDPTLLGDLYSNLSRAQSLAATPFQPYSGQQVAAFAPDQIQAQGQMADIANNHAGSAPLNAAIGAAQGAASYVPQMVQAPQLSGADLTPYLNPYQSSVIDSTLNDLNRQHQIQTAANNAQATSANAFGGSRSAVLQNLSDDSFDRTLASTLANLNQGNFSQAQAAAEGDLNRQLTASQANQNAGIQGAQLNLGAAGTLGNLGNAQLNQALQQAGALNSAGEAQQQNQQAQLNAAYQQWQLAQQYPLTMQQLMNQTLGTFPSNYGTTSTTRDTTGENVKVGDNDGTVFNGWLNGLFGSTGPLSFLGGL
jgi:hypothetical protein